MVVGEVDHGEADLGQTPSVVQGLGPGEVVARRVVRRPDGCAGRHSRSGGWQDSRGVRPAPRRRRRSASPGMSANSDHLAAGAFVLDQDHPQRGRGEAQRGHEASPHLLDVGLGAHHGAEGFWFMSRTILRSRPECVVAHPQAAARASESGGRTGKESAVRRRRGRVSMEYAGAVEVEPPFRGGAQEWVRDAGWTPSRDGRTIRPRDDTAWTTRSAPCARWCRSTTVSVPMPASWRPTTPTRATWCWSPSATAGSRGVRPRRPQVREGSNVIDLATHRRTISRQIG